MSEHGEAAHRDLASGLVLYDVPVLLEEPVFHADKVHDDPRGRLAMAAESTADEHQVTLGHDQLEFMGELVG
jgi:hypothetical protein